MSISLWSRRLLAPAATSLVVALVLAGVPLSPQAQPAAPGEAAAAAEPAGPIRLRQPQAQSSAAVPQPTVRTANSERPYTPGEFERYVQRQVGADPQIRRLGAELLSLPMEEAAAAEDNVLVPPDYIVAPGDEVLVNLWGSVDADLRLLVDRGGRIHLPRIGPVQVGGVQASELEEVVSRRVAQVFRNFDVSVSLGQLRGIRVFVTGNVVRPGTYGLSSLGTITLALMKAGGPSASGTFREIELRRGNAVVGRLDLYALLVNGDRSADRLLQAGDVVHVGPVGVQVALIGSVNRPALLELRGTETVDDALRYAGGFTAVADRTRLTLERLEERLSRRVIQLAWPEKGTMQLAAGDVLRAFSAVDSLLSTQAQSKRIRVEGEVLRPGDYVLPAASSVADALAAAGGFTPKAYVFATEFTRESVRQNQQQNYERALRDLETDLARAGSTQRISNSDEAAARTAIAASQTRLIERLRSLQPSGRLVLQLEPESQELPNLALEDGDRLYVPPRPTSVGVFGSVFNSGSYLYKDGRALGEYLRLAGGSTRGADSQSTFVVRANGSVISARHRRSGWFDSEGDGFGTLRAEPGDTIFVPEEMNKRTLVESTKDWTQILYQFGLGIAGIVSAIR
jgi:protein involved in polysaccharide export with SLBB domain